MYVFRNEKQPGSAMTPGKWNGKISPLAESRPGLSGLAHAEARVAEKHGRCYGFEAAATHLLTISMDLGGETSLGNRRFLDLGCGSVGAAEHRDYEPWLARLLHAAGARVIGVDIGKQGDEDFVMLQRDLAVPGALSDLKEEFDCIICRNLISFQEESGFGPDISPMLLKRLNDAQLRSMKNELLAQTMRLLKEDGLFLTSYGKYRKTEGRLEMLSPPI